MSALLEINDALKRCFDPVKRELTTCWWVDETADIPPWVWSYTFNHGSNALRKRFTNAALERLSRGPVVQVFKGPATCRDLLASVSHRPLR